MDFNAHNMNALANDECERKSKEKYKDIIDAISNAAKEGKFCIDVTDLSNECVQWLIRLDFGVYRKRRDNRWVSADEIDLSDIGGCFPWIETKELYRIAW